MICTFSLHSSFLSLIDNISLTRNNIITSNENVPSKFLHIYHWWNACRGVCLSGSKVTKKVETDSVFFYICQKYWNFMLKWLFCWSPTIWILLEGIDLMIFKEFSYSLFDCEMKTLVTVCEWKFIHFFFVTRRIVKVFFRDNSKENKLYLFIFGLFFFLHIKTKWDATY